MTTADPAVPRYDAEDVGEEEDERDEGDRHGGAHDPDQVVDAESRPRDRRRVVHVEDHPGGDDEGGHRGVEDRPREVDEFPLEVERLEVLAGRREELQGLDHLVDGPGDLLGVLDVRAQAPGLVDLPGVVVIERRGHQPEGAEFGSLKPVRHRFSVLGQVVDVVLDVPAPVGVQRLVRAFG